MENPSVLAKTPAADRDGLLTDLLATTSRTFALAIPLLPPDLERQVRLAYLLFRIADTFEDATVLWSREQRLAGLADFADLVREPTEERARELARSWTEKPPVDHAGYLRLLGETPAVIGEALALGPEVSAILLRHTLRTTVGMAGFVRRTDEAGLLRLRDLPDLRAYCYVVAGIVGEMLTELFLHARPGLADAADALRDRAAAFGEGLQLTNILKDSDWDRTEGRTFVPPAVPRESVFALARAGLEKAKQYCLAVQGTPDCEGIAFFTSLTVGLAFPTLDKVEARGAGSKISRPRVLAIYNRLQRRLAAGEPVFDG